MTHSEPLRPAAETYELVARIVDDPAHLDVEHTWVSNGLTGYRHTGTACKRLPKRRSSVYHRLTLREASRERLCPECLLPGIAEWLGVHPPNMLSSIVDDVARAESLLDQIQAPTPSLTSFVLAEMAEALDERLKGRAARVAAVQASLTQVGQRLSTARQDALAAIKDGASDLAAPIVSAAMRPNPRSTLTDAFASAEEMSVLGDTGSGIAAQHTHTGALLNLWIENVQRLMPAAERRQAALAWAGERKLESLAQLDHVPGALGARGVSARAAAEAAWRRHLPVVVDTLIDRWETMLASRLAEPADVLVAYYSRFHPGDPAMRAALFVFDTNASREGKRLLLAPRAVATWIANQAPERGSYAQTRYIETAPSAGYQLSVLDTAIALWDPAANYSAYRSFTDALAAASALN